MVLLLLIMTAKALYGIAALLAAYVIIRATRTRPEPEVAHEDIMCPCCDEPIKDGHCVHTWSTEPGLVVTKDFMCMRCADEKDLPPNAIYNGDGACIRAVIFSRDPRPLSASA